MYISTRAAEPENYIVKVGTLYVVCLEENENGALALKHDPYVFISNVSQPGLQKISVQVLPSSDGEPTRNYYIYAEEPALYFAKVPALNLNMSICSCSGETLSEVSSLMANMNDRLLSIEGKLDDLSSGSAKYEDFHLKMEESMAQLDSLIKEGLFDSPENGGESFCKKNHSIVSDVLSSTNVVKQTLDQLILQLNESFAGYSSTLAQLTNKVAHSYEEWVEFANENAKDKVIIDAKIDSLKSLIDEIESVVEKVPELKQQTEICHDLVDAVNKLIAQQSEAVETQSDRYEEINQLKSQIADMLADVKVSLVKSSAEVESRYNELNSQTKTLLSQIRDSEGESIGIIAASLKKYLDKKGDSLDSLSVDSLLKYYSAVLDTAKTAAQVKNSQSKVTIL